MHGKNRQAVAAECVNCGKFFAISIDLDDLARWRDGVLCQDAFVDENGVPYISDADRELLCLSNVCGECWKYLCPDPNTHPTHYH